MNIQKDIKLPQRFKDLFSSGIKSYDNKKYDKCIKNCDKILQEYPDHPQSQSIKALCLSNKNQFEQALTLAKKALYKNLGNFHCWHIYGILNRTDKNNNEALKCYIQAHKLDSKNYKVLKELAYLQAQELDFKGLRESKVKLFNERADLIENWTGRIVAQYLVGNYSLARSLNTSAISIMKQNGDQKRLHFNQMHSFMVRCFFKEGKYQDARVYLKENQLQFTDKTKYWESLATSAQRTENFQEEVQCLRKLIDRNSENYSYIDKYLSASLSAKKEEFKTEQEKNQLSRDVLSEMQMSYPKSKAIHKFFLRSSVIDDQGSKLAFIQNLKKYIKPLILKGFPSLINQLSFIYKSQEKTQILEDILNDYNNTQSSQCLISDPVMKMWITYFLAGHYDRIRNLSKALQLINKAINHTPTQIDLYTLKARIWKHCGNSKAAVLAFIQGRQLDEADRYHNAKCAKYLLRNGQIQLADTEMKKFVKDPETGNLNVHQMQCMWWENELGNAARKQGNYLLALKNYTTLDNHFQVYSDDLFDFHGYSLKKYMINVYLDSIQWQMRIRKSKAFVKGAIGLIKVYSSLMNQVVRDKYKQLLKTKSEEIEKINQSTNKSRRDDEWKRHDRDPEGLKIMNDLLLDEKNIKMNKKRKQLAKQLIQQNGDSNIALYTGFKEMRRCKNYFFMLKTIIRMQQLCDASDSKARAQYLISVCRFRSEDSPKEQKGMDLIRETIDEEIKNILTTEEAMSELKDKSQSDVDFCYYYTTVQSQTRIATPPKQQNYFCEQTFNQQQSSPKSRKTYSPLRIQIKPSPEAKMKFFNPNNQTIESEKSEQHPTPQVAQERTPSSHASIRSNKNLTIQEQEQGSHQKTQQRSHLTPNPFNSSSASSIHNKQQPKYEKSGIDDPSIQERLQNSYKRQQQPHSQNTTQISGFMSVQLPPPAPQRQEYQDYIYQQNQRRCIIGNTKSNTTNYSSQPAPQRTSGTSGSLNDRASSPHQQYQSFDDTTPKMPPRLQQQAKGKYTSNNTSTLQSKGNSYQISNRQSDQYNYSSSNSSQIKKQVRFNQQTPQVYWLSPTISNTTLNSEQSNGKYEQKELRQRARKNVVKCAREITEFELPAKKADVIYQRQYGAMKTRSLINKMQRQDNYLLRDQINQLKRNQEVLNDEIACLKRQQMHTNEINQRVFQDISDKQLQQQQQQHYLSQKQQQLRSTYDTTVDLDERQFQNQWRSIDS